MKNHKRYVNITCPNNHTYDQRYDGFKYGYRCKECKKLSYNQVKEYIESFDYTVLSDTYSGNHVPIKLMCPKGHVISMQYANFSQGKRCRVCANNVKHSYDYVKSYIESEDGYKLLSNEYVNWETKLKIQCRNGHIYYASFNTFQSRHRCTYCNRSIGEEKISKFLKTHNIQFEKEYIFKDCVDKWFLRFDFYIPSLNTCIEFDGRQHFEIVNYGGNPTKEELEERLIDIQKKDRIKNEYCKNNNISLIRISYKELSDIDNILSNRLLK